MPQSIPLKEKLSTASAFKIAPFRKHIRKTEPHRHNNYFEVIYLSKGKGTHLIDDEIHEIKSPIVFILKKDQVHAWDITEEPEGFVILIKDTFLENLQDPELKMLFNLFWRIAQIEVSQFDQDIQLLMEQLYTTFNRETTYKKTVSEGLLKALLGILLSSSDIKLETAAIEQYTQFISVLSSEKLSTRSLTSIAKELGVDQKKINASCQAITGKSAKTIIDEFVMTKAKRLLRYSSLTIDQIADELLFNDGSYFVKFFKRFEGRTPASYREETSRH